MNEWKKFDESNPPNLGVEFLVCSKGGYFKVAELELWFDGKLRWTESQEQLIVHNVTHYAEINIPNDAPDPDAGYIYCPNCGRVKED